MSDPVDDIFLPGGAAVPPSAPLAMPKQVLEVGWGYPGGLLRRAMERLAAVIHPQIAGS